MNLTRSSFTGKIFWTILLFSVKMWTAQAQTISYVLPETFSTCTPAQFAVTITNNSGDLMENNSVEVLFPCEIIYTGSLTNATEEDVSNLSQPIFSINDIPEGESVTFTFDALAPCNSQTCTDAQILQNTINLTSSTGTATVTTDPFTVEHPYLILQSVTPPVISGQQGEIVTRVITIKNTRFGFLTDFNLTDNYTGGITINSDLGVGTTTGNTFNLSLSADDFMTTGNHDAYFDYNETITITEEILITACYFDQNAILSNISINWGCGDDTCQSPSPHTTGLINVLPGEETSGDLVFEPLVTVPDCFCGPAGFQQGLEITNSGNIAVDNITVSLQQYFAGSGIGENSIQQIIDNVPSPANAFYTGSTGSSCTFPTTAFHNAVVNITTIPAQSAITLVWDTYFCTDDACNIDETNWRYSYSYPKICAAPGSDYISGSGSASGTYTPPANAGLTFQGDAGFDDNETKTMTYNVNSGLLAEPGKLSINFTIPCGFTVSNTHDWDLGDDSPANVSVEEIDGNTIINLTYDLPADANNANIQFDLTYDCDNTCGEQLCKDTIISGCPSIAECFPPPVPEAEILSETIFDINSGCQDGCGIKRCQKTTFTLNCDNPDVCETIIPGYTAYTQTFERTTLGVPDNNDDYIPDGAFFDLAHIRLDHAIPSDTIRNTLRGVVHIDVAGTTFGYGLIEIALLHSGQSFGNESFNNFYNHLKVVDASSGNQYECTLSPDPAKPDIFSYEISPAVLHASGCNIPADFVFDSGDSIIFVSDFRININPKNANGDPVIKGFSATPNIYLNDAPAPIEELFSCGCASKTMSISGYKLNFGQGTYLVPPCGVSSHVSADNFFFRLAENNFFPFEYRGLAKLSNWKIKIDDHFSLYETNIKRIRVNGSQIVSDEIITPVNTDGFLSFDLSNYQSPSLDESFSFFIQYKFEADCHITGSYSMNTVATVELPSGLLLEDNSPVVIEKTGNKLQTLEPNLLIQSPIPNHQSDDNTAHWDISFISIPVSAIDTVRDAENCWIYPVSPTGLIDNFRLLNTNGDEITSENGIFEIGTMVSDDSLHFQLIADNNSCKTEDIIVKYGWNCTPYTHPVQDHCNEQNYTLTAFSSSGQLEMNVINPAVSTFDLCDTIPFYQIDIYNADKGSIFDLKLKVTVPDGMEIIAGSSELSYPSIPLNFSPFSDPTDLGNNTFEWDISSLVDTIQENGLVGILSDPQNRVSIRFKSKTSCDYTAGSYFIFSTSAYQNCAEPTNTVTKPGNPLHITNVSAQYTTTIEVTPGIGPDCDDMLPVAVNMQFSSTTNTGDSVEVVLPDGIRYIAGSASNSIGEPVIQNNKLLWQLPSGLSSLDFLFQIEGFNDLPCGQMNLLFSTSSTANALCVTDMDSCTVNVLTGSKTVNINLEKPVLELSNLTGTVNETVSGIAVDLSFEITNSGTPAHAPINIDLYVDTNHDDIFSDGDDLVAQFPPYQEDIQPGESVTVHYDDLNMSGIDFCDLMFVIKVDDNCACQTHFVKISAPIIFNHQDTTSCSGLTLHLGSAGQAGHDYEWIPNDYLSCTDCAEADFTFVNEDYAPASINFVLNDSDNDGCLIKNNYHIDVQPQLGIVSDDMDVCVGNEVTILATAGVSYNWTGAGITNPNQQHQTLTINESSTYSVTVTDAFGCNGSGSLNINALPLPVVHAGDDFMVCTSDNVFLNADFNPDYTYTWSPSEFLSDSTIYNPQIDITETTTFHLLAWDGHCFGDDDVTVTLNNEVIINPPEDITICAGLTDTLTVTGDADSYTWMPAVNCLLDDCSTVEISPVTSTTYSIIGSTDEGCTDTVYTTVTVVTDTIYLSDTITVCGDSTVLIFGEPVSTPGIYCDTTTVGGDDCIKIECIELIKNDTSLIFLSDEICEGNTYPFFGNNLTESGTYSEVLTNSNGCDSTVVLDLVVHPTPAITILPADASVAEGDSLQLEITENFVHYSWLPADTTISCTDCPDPIVSPTTATTYRVTVTDGNGCIGTDSVTVNIKAKCVTESIIKSIPNIFSPNNDNKNDFFRIPEDNIDDLIIAFEIWDRWGQKVFAANNNHGWDGNYKGAPAPVDTYFYTIKFKCSESKEQIHRGDVTLVR